MLPEVQIVKHDLAAGARRRHETSASASATSETLALCRIGKQYAVNREQRCQGGPKIACGACAVYDRTVSGGHTTRL